jgi:hypothetical protein
LILYKEPTNVKRSIFRRTQKHIEEQTASRFSASALCGAATLIFVLVSCAAVTCAQELEDAAPPPPRAISNDERAQLAAAERNKRTQVSLTLATNRLVRAEGFTTQQQYAAASTELGAYQALIEDALVFIQKQIVGSKQRDSFKRYEQALRAHTSRIEAVRRITPPFYAVHVATTIKVAQRARTKALDGFFGAEVMRDRAPDTPDSPASSSSGEQSRTDGTSDTIEDQPPILN